MADQIIQCERCQRKYQVPQHLAGKAFHCKNCDHVVLIPDLPKTHVEEYQELEEPPAPIRRETRRSIASEVPVQPDRSRRHLRERREEAVDRQQASGGLWHVVVGAGSAVVTVLVILGIQSLWRGPERIEVASGQTVSAETIAPEGAAGNSTEPEISQNSVEPLENTSTGTPSSSGSVQPTATQVPPTSTASGTSPSFVGTPAIVAPAAFAPPATSADRNDSGSSNSVPQPVETAVAGGSGTEPRTASSSSGSINSRSPNSTTAASANSGVSEADKPGRYGKSKYSIQIPDGFVLEDVKDDPDEFQAEWRTVDTSIDKLARLEFSLRINPALVAGSRPPLYAEGGVFLGSGEMYIATGGKLETLELGSTIFFKLTYPKGAGEKNKWVMMAHFDGARVKFEGHSSAPAPDSLLNEIVATFSSTNTKFVTPSRPSGVGFDGAEMSSATGFSPAAGTPESTGSGAVASATNTGAPAAADEWGGSGGGRIIRLKRPPGVAAPLAFSGTPPRFILNGGEVLNAVTGDLVVTLPAELEDGGSAISSDGKRVAHFADDFGHEVAVIQIYSCDSPETPPVRIENPEGTWRIGAMRFLDANRLIVHTQSDGWIVWDSTTGKKLTTIEGGSPSDAGLTFSHDGRYMAVADHRTVLVYDTSRGRVAARMARNHNGRDLNLFSCSGLAFSPDMQELAGLFSDGQFVVWSNKGEIILEEILSDIERSMGRDMSAVFYLPDKSGWFLNGKTLLDRKTMTFLWEINEVAWHDGVSSVLDQNTVMTTSNDGGDLDLVFLTIPWEKIRAAQGEMTQDAKPLLTRGGAVSLEVQMGEVRFADSGQTQASIIDGFKQRLTLNEVSIAENQPVKLIVSYSEASGGQKTVRNMFGRLGGGTAETVVEDTEITVNVEMRVEGRSEPIWKREIKEEIDLIVDAELNPQAFRNNNFTRALQSIQRLNIPTRINNNGDSALPVRTSL